MGDEGEANIQRAPVDTEIGEGNDFALALLCSFLPSFLPTPNLSTKIIPTKIR